jgi:hypothetical protein
MGMQEYPIKRGYKEGFEERIVEGLEKYFGTAPAETDGHYIISYGVLKRLEVYTGEGGKTFVVDTESEMTVDDDAIILDTNRRFRQYLEYVTGFSAKERAKKAKKVV